MLRAAKRIEIITGASDIDEVVGVLEKAGVTAYTVDSGVARRGGRAHEESDGLPGVFKNGYVLAACAPDEAERVLEALRPLLKRTGGLALAWDCVMLK